MSAEWHRESLGEGRTRVTYTIAVDYAWYEPDRTVREHLKEVLAEVVRGVQRWSDERPASPAQRR